MIATGGKPASHPINGLEKCMTSNEILDLDYLPKKLAVLGSGYISLEFASIFKKLGSEVSVFFRSDFPLKGFDLDIRKKIAKNLAELGINLYPNSQIQGVEQQNGNFTLKTKGFKDEFSKILNGLGRTPNSGNLGLENMGIKLGSNGEIPVNEYSQTAINGVFAIGDVTNRMNLTPVAIAEGRAFAENEFNKKNLTINYDSIASAVFTSPAIGSIGLTENQAVSLKLKKGIKIYESEFRPMRLTFTSSMIKTYMKLIIDAHTDLILGIHLIGPEAPELIQVLAIPFKMRATKQDFDNTIAVHPTSAEELVLMRNPIRSIPS
jgi:glutathione reductase (NADPH)